MITHTFSRGWNNGGSSLSKATAVISGAESNLDESIPADTADQLVAFALDVSQCKGLYIVCDRALVVKTNSSGSPVNTITLAANTPFVWVYGDAPLRDTSGAAITTDITSLHVDNEDPDNAALLQLRCIYDPTV